MSISRLYLAILVLITMLFASATSPEKVNEDANKMEGKMKSIKDKVIKAPELRAEQWIDANGEETSPIKLSDYKGKFKIIYCFQHWCPGCHSVGLPSLKRLVDEFSNNENIAFLAVQTVFEGSHANTYDKIAETQKKYELKIPFGHDPGNGRSTIMEDYQTGGTPWFILIDQEDNVVFADFHLNLNGTIDYLKEVVK